jgi:nucleotide-binding universal stress UspA family protein
MIQRILLAWDGSPVALRAFDAAIDLARRYDAELIAVSIANAPLDAETSADRDDSASAARRYLEASFGEVRDRAERAGVGVEHRTIEASAPGQALAHHAREHGFDLIVCGHHHPHRAGRLLLRGVSEDLLAITTTPVLVISEGET